MAIVAFIGFVETAKVSICDAGVIDFIIPFF
jgi:hypothetical protein